MTYTRMGAVVLAALAVSAIAGCDSPGFSHKAKSPDGMAQTPPVVGTTRLTSASALPPVGSSVVQTPVVFSPALGVSDIVARECGIQPREAKNETVPTFDYDSATLAPADRDILAEVAKCLTEGALRGREVALVGHTDARGEPEYNMGLGSSRSTTVQRYLVDLGVGRERLRPSSRGEIDATGTDEAGWAKDRRVDIELAL